MISNISKRYARAFFEIAGEEKKLEQYYSELSQFSSAMSGNKDLAGFLANPVFEQDVKKNVLEKIIGKMSAFSYDGQFLKVAG